MKLLVKIQVVPVLHVFHLEALAFCFYSSNKTAFTPFFFKQTF